MVLRPKNDSKRLPSPKENMLLKSHYQRLVGLAFPHVHLTLDPYYILYTIYWPIAYSNQNNKKPRRLSHRNLPTETAPSSVLHGVHMSLTFPSHSPTWFHAMRCTRTLLSMAWVTKLSWAVRLACSKHAKKRLHASSKGMFDIVWSCVSFVYFLTIRFCLTLTCLSCCPLWLRLLWGPETNGNVHTQCDFDEV